MPVDAGTSIGRYEILSHLGAGGMGEVYLARDTALGRTVALKILPAAIASDEQRMQRFVQEAKTASSLNHPNILTIHEFGRADAVHFIATEFVDGSTLCERLTHARMPVDEVLDVAVQTASALAASHAAGVVHRDIKPDNIMLRRDGYVKVLDFGLAKPAERDSASVDTEAETRAFVYTNPGTVMGTISYMSPEQTRGRALDGRTDIWSLGVVLYEMIAGRVPFEGETSSDVIVSVLDREPLPLTGYAPDTPVELQRIVRKALRKDREERYQTVKDMLVDLRSLKQDLEFESKLERSLAPESKNRNSGSNSGGSDRFNGGHGAAAARAVNWDPLARTGAITTARRTVSAEYPGHAPAGRKRGLMLAFIVAGIIALTGLFGFALYKYINYRQSKASAPFQSMKVTRLTNTGKAGSTAISPDGKWIVYVVNEAGQQSIWVKQVAAPGTQQIIPPAEVHYGGLTFSRDGNYVFYLKMEKSKLINDLYQIPALGGGAPKKVIADVDSPVTLAPDGKQLAFLRHEPVKGEAALMIANTDGTGEKALAVRKLPEFFGTPAWSPDGKIIATTAGNSVGAFSITVVQVSVADGSQKPLTPQIWRQIWQMAWLKDGSGLVMNAVDRAPNSTSQVWHLAYPGGEAHRITNDLNNYEGLSLAADASALVTVQADKLGHFWIAPSGAASRTARDGFPVDADRARQITSGTEKQQSFSWTPDGKIVYSSNASGNWNIWTMEADGSSKKQLTSDTSTNIYPAVSPDGRYVVFTSDRSGTVNVWRMDADGSNLKQLTAGNFNQLPRFSPDGKWIVYTSFASNKPVVAKLSIEGGDPVPLTDKYSGSPVVSPDGKLVACHYWDEILGSPIRIALIPFDGGRPVKTFDIPSSYVRWSADGRALTYVENRAGVSNVWSQPIAGGPPVQLTDFKSDLIFWFDWSRDGRQLGLGRGAVTSDVVLFSNFK